MNWLTYIFEEPIHINLGTWLLIGDIHINYGLIFDSLSMTVIVPVGIVSLAVIFYAIDYMRNDPNRNTFYIILSIFAIFMTILVMSDNYLMMFIGWEFVGVISYLLIGFWNTRITAMKSALSAILLNRMGDTFYMITLGILLSIYHALDFDTISLLAPHSNTTILNILGLLLLLAATAKSAQLGLHSWLLLAMEGHSKYNTINKIEELLRKNINLIKNILNKINRLKLKEIINPSKEFYILESSILPTKLINNVGKNKSNKPVKIHLYDIDELKEIEESPFNSKLECSKYFKYE